MRITLMIVLITLILPTALYSSNRIIAVMFEGNAENSIIYEVRAQFVNRMYKLNKGKKNRILERSKLKMVMEEQKIRGGFNHNVKYGKTIGADYLIVGSVNKGENGSIDIKANVIDVKTQNIVKSFDENIKNVNQLENKVNNLADNSFKLVEGPKEWDISISTNYNFILPVGKYSDIVKPGHGITCNISFDYFLNKAYQINIETGAYFHKGQRQDINTSTVVPVLIGNRYNFKISDKFSITQELLVGFAYIAILNKTEEKTSGVDPLFYLGVKARYKFSSYMYATGGVRYGFFIENQGVLQMINTNIGIGISF